MADGGGDEGEVRATVVPGERRPVPRSPLIIGGIAYALLFWMVFVVLMLIAWRLFGG